jgi:hypothetical protein
VAVHRCASPCASDRLNARFLLICGPSNVARELRRSRFEGAHHERRRAAGIDFLFRWGYTTRYAATHTKGRLRHLSWGPSITTGINRTAARDAGTTRRWPRRARNARTFDGSARLRHLDASSRTTKVRIGPDSTRQTTRLLSGKRFGPEAARHRSQEQLSS